MSVWFIAFVVPEAGTIPLMLPVLEATQLTVALLGEVLRLIFVLSPEQIVFNSVALVRVTGGVTST